MPHDKHLFSDFPNASRAEWQDVMQRESKGRDVADLHTILPGGIDIDPIQTPEDRKNKRSGIPERGQKHRDLIEAVKVEDAAVANKMAIDALESGASALLFYLHPGVDLQVLLKDALIEHIATHWVAGGDTEGVCNDLIAIAKQRNLKPIEIKGSFHADPCENLLRTGNWITSEEADFERINRLLKSPFSSMRMIAVSGNIYHNAGASAIQELAFTLAQAHEYLLRHGGENAGRFIFYMAIGPQYLVEVAKFRALRLLWNRLLSEYNLPGTPMHLVAENGMRNKSQLDIHTNMLRTTTEAMSALVGGADEIRIAPYNECSGNTTDHAERTARNQMLVMQYESFLDKVEDPAAGAYAIEDLTDQLCKKAWDKFCEIEAAGGLLHELKAGNIQTEIARSDQLQRKAYGESVIQLVGANVFPNPKDKVHPHNGIHKNKPRETAMTPLQTGRLSEVDEQERMKTSEA